MLKLLVSKLILSCFLHFNTYQDLVDERLKGSQLDKEVGSHFDSMGLANTEAQSQRIISLVKNIRNRASTILCAPTMTGKTILLKVKVEF